MFVNNLYGIVSESWTTALPSIINELIVNPTSRLCSKGLIHFYTSCEVIACSYDQKTSVRALLQQLKLEPLDERRRVNWLAFMHRILNKHLAITSWILL